LPKIHLHQFERGGQVPAGKRTGFATCHSQSPRRWFGPAHAANILYKLREASIVLGDMFQK